MGLSRALFSGISGLKGHQVRLDVIGNNIANVNTTGFKKSRVTFSDLFYDTVSEGSSPSQGIGGQNPKQIGLGAGSAVVEQIMTDGATQITGVATDLALTGEGFFVVGDASTSLYTRDGNFKQDEIGDLVAAGSNLRVKGWMAERDSNGKFTVDTSSSLDTINVQTNRKMYASPTDRIEYASNLDSGSAERTISQADTFIAFKDNASEDPSKQGDQKLNFSFQKIDGQTYTWKAADTEGRPIATGELKFNDFGEIISSSVKGSGSTQVNYDPSDSLFPDVLTMDGAASIVSIAQPAVPPNGTYFYNQSDANADMVFDPDSDDFRRLSDRQKPRAFSFTYDPDGIHKAGSWQNANAPITLRGNETNKNSNAYVSITGNLSANTGKVNLVVNQIEINNSYIKTLTTPSQIIDKNTTATLKVSITGPAAGGNTLNATVWQIPPSGVANAIRMGAVYGIDPQDKDMDIAIPGRISLKIRNNGPNNFEAGSVEFPPMSSGSFGASNGTDFSLNNTAFNQGNSKFEIRYVDASQSEYQGDLRIQFTGANTFQLVDDANQVLTTGTLRDGEVDTLVEVSGISMVIHREGDALDPLEVSQLGLEGTAIRLRGFTKATGTAGPITVNIPKPLDLDNNGQVPTPSSNIDFNFGFSKASAETRTALSTAALPTSTAAPPTAGAPDGGWTAAELLALNTARSNTFPAGTVTVDATNANSGSGGQYRVEFGLRDPAVSEQDPTNQVLRVYQNGVELYVVDLNGAMDDQSLTTGQYKSRNGTDLQNSNYLPTFNFFSEMATFKTAFDGGDTSAGGGNGVDDPVYTPPTSTGAPVYRESDVVRDMNRKVTRQINLPNGVVINLSNVDASGSIGRAAANASNDSANFFVGDSYSFNVVNPGKAGLTEISTYSAAFQRGAVHSTAIETFDSVGGSHSVRARFEHVDKEGREWRYYISLDETDPLIQDFLFNPPSGFSVIDPRKPTEQELRQANDYVVRGGRVGKLVFNEEGTLDPLNSVVPRVIFKPADAAEVNISLDMTLVTQFEEQFGTAARFRTGNKMGLLQGYSIDNTGQIVGSYSNGQKAVIAQVAVASFNNPEGLIRNGSNVFDVSGNSGIPRIGTAGSDDRGLIKSGSLEGSNVDLTDEFTDLIVTQRAFSANGRVITTSDEFLQEILQLKR